MNQRCKEVTKLVFMIQPACLCPNSCATMDDRQRRMTDKDTPHIVMQRRNVVDTMASYLENMLGQHFQQQRKHSAPNVMMYSLGERRSISGVFTLVEQPTKIVKSDDDSGREFAGLILVCIRSRCGLVVVKSKVAKFHLDIFPSTAKKKPPTTQMMLFSSALVLDAIQEMK